VFLATIVPGISVAIRRLARIVQHFRTCLEQPWFEGGERTGGHGKGGARHPTFGGK
jgi:hypothetical protein